MTKRPNDLPSPLDPQQSSKTDMVELDALSIAAVSGGLNPQPLPPLQNYRFSGLVIGLRAF